jgi:aspartate/methionine/tyrosine aminotransferase
MNISEFRLERYLASHEFSARYLLCTSDCESLSINELLSLEEGASDSFQNLVLGYTESQGSPSLREEIARWYSSISPDQVVVTTGAEETIFISMQVLLRPGDHVIVQTPAYQSLYELPRVIGCQVTPWDLQEEGGRWILNPDTLHELVHPSTRFLVVNSPHNPTGHTFSPAEWNEIHEICEDNRISVISDEVYRGAEHSSSACLPAMADCSDTGYSIGVMSKAFGLAGLRIGWMASHDTDFIRKFLAFKDYTTICNSGPSEFLATVALRHKNLILKRNLSIIEKNLESLTGFFRRNSSVLTCSRPDAGSTAFPRLIDDISGDDFCSRVLHRSGILLLPGTVFGVDTPHFRIGYGREDFVPNLTRFEECINEFKRY